MTLKASLAAWVLNALVKAGDAAGKTAPAANPGAVFPAAMDHGKPAAPTLLSLIETEEHRTDQGVVEEASPRRSRLAEILMRYPTDLIDLVLSAPTSGAIAKHVKKLLKEEKAARFDASR